MMTVTSLLRDARRSRPITAVNICVSAVAMIATLCIPLTVGAPERFTGVEYLAGRADLPKPFEATLVLDDQQLRVEQTVYSKQGRSVRTVFTIALTNITTIGASLAREPGSSILAGLVGWSSPTDHHEYVTITMEAVRVQTSTNEITVFEFGPDGLVFDIPAKLTVETQRPDGEIVDLYWWN